MWMSKAFKEGVNMINFRDILERLRQPSVVLSIASQIVTILLLLNVNVDQNIVTGVVTAVCSILVFMGIMSNPTTQNKWYGDDTLYCKNCQKNTAHLSVADKMICSTCSTTFTPPTIEVTEALEK